MLITHRQKKSNTMHVRFQELEKYIERNDFFFRPEESLAAACNAPDDRFGIYLVYAVENGQETLIYIGMSGNEFEDGINQQKRNSLKGQFVAGIQFDAPRQQSWPKQMKMENIEKLRIYWYAIPANDSEPLRELEMKLFAEFRQSTGVVPRWNVHR